MWGVKVLEIFVFTLRKHVTCMLFKLDTLSNASVFFPKKNDANDNTKTIKKKSKKED